MKDLYKEKMLLALGYMYDSKCTCCNWTLRKTKRKLTRILKHTIRSKMKQELRMETANDNR